MGHIVRHYKLAGPTRMDNKVSFSDGKIIHGDCMDTIVGLDNDSIDLVFTSPPYFQGKDYDNSILLDDFLQIIEDCQRELYPKLRPGASLCWQVGSQVRNGVTTPLDLYVHQVCLKFPELKLRNRVIWTFGHGEHAKKRLSGRYETVLWYTKGSNYQFNLDDIRVPQKYPGKRHYKGPNRGKWSGNPLGKNPGDVWEIPNVKANHVEKTKHPCQFPVALVTRFIRALTVEDDLVVDPYSGSSTSAIAALECKRQFLCIEIEKPYFDISVQRINDWYAGKEKVRADLPSATPDPRSAVAARPPHFVGGDLE